MESSLFLIHLSLLLNSLYLSLSLRILISTTQHPLTFSYPSFSSFISRVKRVHFPNLPFTNTNSLSLLLHLIQHLPSSSSSSLYSFRPLSLSLSESFDLSISFLLFSDGKSEGGKSKGGKSEDGRGFGIFDEEPKLWLEIVFLLAYRRI